MESICFICIILISVILHKIGNVFKNLRSDGLRAQNFAAH